MILRGLPIDVGGSSSGIGDYVFRRKFTDPNVSVTLTAGVYTTFPNQRSLVSQCRTPQRSARTDEIPPRSRAHFGEKAFPCFEAPRGRPAATFVSITMKQEKRVQQAMKPSPPVSSGCPNCSSKKRKREANLPRKH